MTYQMKIDFRNELSPFPHQRLAICGLLVKGRNLVMGYQDGAVVEMFSHYWQVASEDEVQPDPVQTPLLTFDDGKPLWVYGILWPPTGLHPFVIEGENYTAEHLPSLTLGGYRLAGDNEEAFYRWGSPALGRDWEMYGEQAVV